MQYVSNRQPLHARPPSHNIHPGTHTVCTKSVRRHAPATSPSLATHHQHDTGEVPRPASHSLQLRIPSQSLEPLQPASSFDAISRTSLMPSKPRRHDTSIPRHCTRSSRAIRHIHLTTVLCMLRPLNLYPDAIGRFNCVTILPPNSTATCTMPLLHAASAPALSIRSPSTLFEHTVVAAMQNYCPVTYHPNSPNHINSLPSPDLPKLVDALVFGFTEPGLCCLRAYAATVSVAFSDIMNPSSAPISALGPCTPRRRLLPESPAVGTQPKFPRMSHQHGNSSPRPLLSLLRNEDAKFIYSSSICTCPLPD